MKRLTTMDDVPLDGKTALVRVDFNVSIGDNGQVDDYEDYRIQAALPTIEELLQRRCKVLLLTHLGRPGEGQGLVDLQPVNRRLMDLLHEEVRLLHNLYGSDVEAAIAALPAGGAVMLPNVRQDEREEAGSDKLAAQLAALAQVYINEAFSVSHRNHTSVAIVPTLLPAAAGRRCVQEYEALTALREQPRTPYVAVVSGAKVSTKLKLLERLLAQVDYLCLGGILANEFLVALEKCPAGTCDGADLAAAQALWAKGQEKIMLPVDVVIGPKMGREGVEIVAVQDIPPEVGGVWDIGPETVKKYLEICRSAGTVLWNGPLGKAEEEAYAAGTIDFALGLAETNAWRVVGGGDTVTALERMRVTSRFDHVSVGGGAMVTLLEGSEMPGLTPLYAQH